MFGKLFCKKKDDKALVQKLRETEEVLKKKRQSLGKRIDAELATIRENVKTNKPVALDALKRKKRYDHQVRQIDGTLKTTSSKLDFQNTLFEIFIFCPKNWLWFPEKFFDFSGWKTRENVVVWDFLAVDSFDFTRKIVKKILDEKLVKMLEFCQKWIFGQKFDF